MPALSLLAVSHHQLGEQKERLQVEIESLDATEVDPENPYNEFAWQYWNIATIAEFEMGDFTIARKYYQRLLDEYPRDRRVYGAKQALKRMDEVEAQLRTAN
jgi:tetratricopeptide (TPR) repeat protein